MYDIIGDIHGHARELRALFAELGYRERHGVYRHPTRKAVFVGDFVDRGLAIRETLQMVRAMVDQESALAVMGNHEFNAICYHTPDGAGGHLRSHTAEKNKNTIQHQSTLDQLAIPYPDQWESYLAWFKSLPLFLELEGLRVVHAAWDPSAIKVVRGRSLHDPEFLRAAATEGTSEDAAVTTLLKGPEVLLPEGWSNPDKEGHNRPDMRLAWWKERASKRSYSFADLAVPGSGTMPTSDIPLASLARCPSYTPKDVPVVFGHYWFRATPPVLLTGNAACIDYSVAKDGGQLVAYSWSGEQTLTPDNFHWVERIESG